MSDRQISRHVRINEKILALWPVAIKVSRREGVAQRAYGLLLCQTRVIYETGPEIWEIWHTI